MDAGPQFRAREKQLAEGIERCDTLTELLFATLHGHGEKIAKEEGVIIRDNTLAHWAFEQSL
jgi:hypothetical protein